MKSDLDHLPPNKVRELHRVRQIVFDEFENATALGTSEWKRKGRIRGILLFGSYARGGWVDDLVGGKGYQSDYDLLVIVSHQKLKDMMELWEAINDRIFQTKGITTPVNIIVHTLGEVNQALSEGRYFFVDIYRDGIEISGISGLKLKSPKPLSPEMALAMAKEHSEFWIKSAKTALKFGRFGLSENDLNESAFNLHQATERIYHALLLTYTNYTPNTHNLNMLRSMSESIVPELIEAWPRATKTDKKPFNKLVEAYVKARYSRHYRIDTETLNWLIERIEILHGLVEKACQNQLKTLSKAVK